MLFVDFSSAFNTIIPEVLLTKLTQLTVPASTCQWITNFLIDLDDIFRTRCLRRACGILKDEPPPPNHLFPLLPSGRRYRATTARTSRLQNSFIPRAITELNNHTTLIPSTQHNCTFFSGCTNKFRCVSNAQ